MRISPISAPTNSVAAPNPAVAVSTQLRNIKMDVNRTPGPAALQEAPSEPPIQDVNSEPKSTVEATQPMSPQFAALAREKRALQVMKRELQEKEKALEAKSQGSDAVPLARLKSEPLKVLLESGVTYDQLTEAILNNQGNPELAALKAELAAVKEGVEQKLTERETHEEQRLYREVTRDAQSIVAANPEAFELLSKMDRVPVAIEVWKREFKETGEFPDMEGVLKDVEEHCLQECQGFTGLKKIQALFSQAAPAPQPRTQGMRTLTNKDTASVPLSRRDRALAAALGTLRK